MGLPIKTVQHRLGHSSIAMTADTYGHLFASGDRVPSWQLPNTRFWANAT